MMKKQEKTAIAASAVELTNSINQKLDELLDLFKQLAALIEKKTDGDRFIADDKLNHAEYWLSVAQKNPTLIAGHVDLDDFAFKLTFLQEVVKMQNSEGTIITHLKESRDIASKDVNWYIAYVKSAVTLLKKNPVYKKMLDNAPVRRQSSTSSVNNKLKGKGGSSETKV